MADFGQEVRRHRTQARLSLRQLAAHAGIDWGYLGQIERGERQCSVDFAEILDKALHADGVLVQAHQEDDVRRRVVLGATVALPLIAADAVSTGVPAVGIEALRHDLAVLLNGGLAEWDEIIWQYACTYMDTPPRAMMDGLRTDLTIAEMQLRKAEDDGTRRTIHRAIGQLAVIMAQTAGNLGDRTASYRWWRTARQHADAANDTETRVWVRGREVVRGLVERRPLTHLLDLADEADAISSTPGVGTGGVLAGRAQVLATLGREREARAAMAQLYDVVPALPERVTDDGDSLFGWPEYRLRHAESYVYTYLGDEDQAEAARGRALTLYPVAMAREAAQVEIHRALRLVRAGDADGGAGHAQAVIEGLPPEQRIEAVLELARRAYDHVPYAARQRPPVAGLREMLALPAGPAH